MAQNFAAPIWMTFKQASELDAHIRKGEKGSLVVTAPLSQIKSPYPHSGTNPNWMVQSLIALLTGLHVPFVTTENHELGEEIVASYLYQVHLYHWLETNHHGRFFADKDL
jgi:hypothetical protein